VWSHAGIICVADILKAAVRLTFLKGAKLQDPAKLFNVHLNSKGVRAIDFHQDYPLNEVALTALILQAMGANRVNERAGAG
jgi:hypothetical protein